MQYQNFTTLTKVIALERERERKKEVINYEIRENMIEEKRYIDR